MKTRRLAGLTVPVLVGFGVMLAASSSISGAGEPRSELVAAERLAAHGIRLDAVPAGLGIARISAETAEVTARAVVPPIAPGRKETFRVLARPTADAAERTAWLFLYEGGTHTGPVGPPEGAESRTFTTDYTGVLIDDQTGELMRWFQSGSFAP